MIQKTVEKISGEPDWIVQPELVIEGKLVRSGRKFGAFCWCYCSDAVQYWGQWIYIGFTHKRAGPGANNVIITLGVGNDEVD